MDMMSLLYAVTMKIFHIMVMILMVFIQYHRKITGIQPGLFHPGDLCTKSVSPDTGKRFFQHLLICSQVKKRCNRHIPADSGITFQI